MKIQHKTYCHLILAIILLPGNIFAQITITLNTPASNLKVADNFWDLTIINAANFKYQIFIEAQLTDSNHNSLTGKTIQFELNSGMTKFTNQSFRNSIHYEQGRNTNPQINENSTLPAGKYQLCLYVRQATDNIVLNMSCVDFIITSDSLRDNLNKKGIFKGFSGNAELFINYGQATQNIPNTQNNYAYWLINPSLNVFDLPFSGQFLLASGQSPVRQNPNIFNFTFDATKFKTALKAKAISKMTEKEQYEKYHSQASQSQINEYKNIRKTLTNPLVIKDLQNIEKLKKIESQLTDSTKIKDRKKYDSLSREYNKYKDVNVKKLGYDRLIKKSNELEKQISDSTKVDRFLLKALTTKNFDPEQEIKSRLTDSLKTHNREKYDSLNRQLTKCKKLAKRAGSYEKLASRLKSSDIENLSSQMTDSLLRTNPEKYDSLQKKLQSYKMMYEKLLIYKKLLNSPGDFNSIMNDPQIKILTNNREALNKYNKYKGYDYKNLENPDELINQVKSLGLVNGFQKYLLAIKSFSVGTSIPVYSNLSLANIPVKGISTELEWNNFYLGFVSGTIQRSILSLGISENCYKRNTTSAILGYGQKNGSHIYFYWLNFSDKQGDEKHSDTLLVYDPPQKNKVVGCMFRKDLFKQKLSVEGELAGSWLLKEQSVSSEGSIYIDSNRYFQTSYNWFKSILSQKSESNNTSVDYAGNLKVKLNLWRDNTQFSSEIRRIGPRYETFGMPFLINDMLSYEFRYTQYLLRRKLSFSAYIKEMKDNLDEFKPLSTSSMKLGFDVSANFPKYPFVKISYTPFAIKNDSQNFYLNLFTAISGYTYKTGKVVNNSTLCYMSQKSVSENKSMNFSNSMYSYNQLINFKSQTSISAGLTYMHTIYTDSVSSTVTTNLAVGFKLLKKLSNSIGVAYNFNKNENRLGYYVGMQWVFMKYFSANVRIDRNVYDNQFGLETYPSYKEVVFRFSIAATW